MWIYTLHVFIACTLLVHAQIDDVIGRLHATGAKILEDSSPVNVTLKKECINRPADIVFLLDSSNSEGVNHFREQLNFAKNITETFDIGPDKVQVSVVTFSEEYHNEFWLNQYSNKAGVLQAIGQILYRQGDTRTDIGLDFVFHESFLPEHGGRNNSDKTIIVLTDGESTNTARTKEVAETIHSTNIRIISIGIGVEANRDELLAIATDANSMRLVANFSRLSDIVGDVVEQTCHIPNFPCRDTPADILFLLGTTGTQNATELQYVLDFVKNFTGEYEIGPDSVQIAVATITNTTQWSFTFNDYDNRDDIVEAIGYINLLPGDIQTSDALSFARQEAFTPLTGGRNESRHIVIFMTNGESTDKLQTSKEASALHNEGFFVISIGIGTGTDRGELMEIASGGQNFFAVSNYDALNTIEVAIEQQTCEYETVCSTRPSDVVFLLDSSTSMGAENFSKQVDFVGNFSQRLIIGPGAVLVSVVTFSSFTKQEFPLGRFPKKDDLLDAIAKITYRPGPTLTDSGLSFVNGNSFKPKNGARKNANQVVILITDGQSTKPQSTYNEASLLHDDGVKVISIGVGDKVDDSELYNIASGSDFTFTVPDFDSLEEFQVEIIESACKANVTECSQESRDIIFLLDSSTSEGSANFKKQLNFVSNFIDGFEIGPNAVQVGVVTYSTETKNRFSLNDYNSIASLRAAINRISYTSGQTHTGSGLEYVRENALTAANGARQYSQKVIVVMTDGQSQQKQLTANQGILLRKEGVKVISIGIGQAINPSELAVIASDDHHVVKVSSFDDLDTVEQSVQELVCKKLVCASTPADILFALDTSSSIGPDNFHDMLNFITDFVKKFYVGTSAVQFGVVTFSNDVYPQFDLDVYTNKSEVIEAIHGIPYHHGGTFTNKALSYIREQSFQPRHGARSEAAHIAVVLTDGQSQSVQRTKQEADLLHAAGVEVIAVGIGSAVNPTELSNIATNISYVFSVATFDSLETIQNELLIATCAAQQVISQVTEEAGPCVAEDRADVMFLLDSSNSEGPNYFQDELRFVEQVVDNFPIGPQDFQFGVIAYASNAHLWLTLNATSSANQLRFALLQVAYEGGLTYLDAALKLARTEGFVEANGARPGVRRMVVIVTDGKSNIEEWTIREGRALKAMGVEIVSIGIGNLILPHELTDLATNPNNVFYVNSFEDLPHYVVDLRRTLCTTLASTLPVTIVTTQPPMVTSPTDSTSGTATTEASTLPTSSEILTQTGETQTSAASEATTLTAGLTDSFTSNMPNVLTDSSQGSNPTDETSLASEVTGDMTSAGPTDSTSEINRISMPSGPTHSLMTNTDSTEVTSPPDISTGSSGGTGPAKMGPGSVIVGK